MRKIGNYTIDVSGENNNITINAEASKVPVAIAIGLGIVVVATVLAVSLCCPEELGKCLKLLIDMLSGN